MGVSKDNGCVFIDIHQESLLTIKAAGEALCCGRSGIIWGTNKNLGRSDCETITQYESFELIIGFHVRLKRINLCFEFTICQLKVLKKININLSFMSSYDVMSEKKTYLSTVP